MAKRGKLEIMQDILFILQQNRNPMKITPLIRRSNMSFERFKKYYSELIKKGLVKEMDAKGNKRIALTNKGYRFLEKYKTIVSFIEEFEL